MFTQIIKIRRYLFYVIERFARLSYCYSITLIEHNYSVRMTNDQREQTLVFHRKHQKYRKTRIGAPLTLSVHGTANVCVRKVLSTFCSVTGLTTPSGKIFYSTVLQYLLPS